MKNIIILLALVFICSKAYSQEAPDYLKDGEITVTLKNGKTYKFSANEYAVVKRNAKKQQEPEKETEVETRITQPTTEKRRLKHIVSGELLRSNSGLNVSSSSNQVDVSTRKEIGVGVQYQYNVKGDVYMGGRIDSNGGAGVSLGLGF